MKKVNPTVPRPMLLSVLMDEPKFLISISNPYKQTVYLESLYLNILNELVVYRCSGSFFLDNLAQGKVLTSAHCVYNVEMNEELVPRGYILGMAVYKGMKDGVHDEVSYAKSVKIPSEYVNGGQIVNDLGVVTMSDDLSIGAGALYLENASSQTVKIGGYPADKPNYNQYIMSGSANLGNGVLDYTIDTYGGQSGAPILNNANNVIGVHSSGSKDNQKNYGTALNPLKILFLKQ